MTMATSPAVPGDEGLKKQQPQPGEKSLPFMEGFTIEFTTPIEPEEEEPEVVPKKQPESPPKKETLPSPNGGETTAITAEKDDPESKPPKPPVPSDRQKAQRRDSFSTKATSSTKGTLSTRGSIESGRSSLSDPSENKRRRNLRSESPSRPHQRRPSFGSSTGGGSHRRSCNGSITTDGTGSRRSNTSSGSGHSHNSKGSKQGDGKLQEKLSMLDQRYQQQNQDDNVEGHPPLAPVPKPPNRKPSTQRLEERTRERRESMDHAERPRQNSMSRSEDDRRSGRDESRRRSGGRSLGNNGGDEKEERRQRSGARSLGDGGDEREERRQRSGARSLGNGGDEKEERRQRSGARSLGSGGDEREERRQRSGARSLGSGGDEKEERRHRSGARSLGGEERSMDGRRGDVRKPSSSFGMSNQTRGVPPPRRDNDRCSTEPLQHHRSRSRERMELEALQQHRKPRNDHMRSDCRSRFEAQEHDGRRRDPDPERRRRRERESERRREIDARRDQEMDRRAFREQHDNERRGSRDLEHDRRGPRDHDADRRNREKRRLRLGREASLSLEDLEKFFVERMKFSESSPDVSRNNEPNQSNTNRPTLKEGRFYPPPQGHKNSSIPQRGGIERRRVPGTNSLNAAMDPRGQPESRSLTLGEKRPSVTFAPSTVFASADDISRRPPNRALSRGNDVFPRADQYPEEYLRAPRHGHFEAEDVHRYERSGYARGIPQEFFDPRRGRAMHHRAFDEDARRRNMGDFRSANRVPDGPDPRVSAAIDPRSSRKTERALSKMEADRFNPRNQMSSDGSFDHHPYEQEARHSRRTSGNHNSRQDANEHQDRRAISINKVFRFKGSKNLSDGPPVPQMSHNQRRLAAANAAFAAVADK